MHRRPRISYVIVAGAVLMVMIAMSPGGATAGSEWTGAAQSLLDRPRAQTPEDRYAMAGGCYTIRSAGGGYVIRDGESFAATGTSLEGAEPFHFQATDPGALPAVRQLRDLHRGERRARRASCLRGHALDSGCHRGWPGAGADRQGGG
jgi:hypothetical protein